jgi:heme o synthase
MKKQSYESIRWILLSSAIATFLLIVMGNVVRTTDAVNACPDWPTCYGQIAMPSQIDAQLQMVHRGLAVLSGLLILLSAILVMRVKPAYRMVRWPIYLSVIAFGLQIFLGKGIATGPTSPWMSPIHFGLALVSLGLITFGTLAAFMISKNLNQADQLRFQTSFSRNSLIMLALTFFVLVSGVVVVAMQAGPVCVSWPLCSGGLPDSGSGWLQFGHRLLVLAAAISVMTLFAKAWRGQRSQIVTLTSTTGLMVLYFGQAFIGALKVSRSFPGDLVGLHAVISAALWSVAVLVVASSALSGRTEAMEKTELAERLDFRQRSRDFLLLNKPIIVLLLLVTTYAGMVVGGKQIPTVGLTLWTLLGGALAAGGSSALNQFLDRDLDKNMQRTARRPLPSGRLTAAEGLAYGVGACLLSFFLMAGMVNLLSALLSLAGMIYYVLFYSIWLKRLTVQNIVIGGGAGAIPPLVGWAAVTGGLNVPSLFLFAIVFLWTPPHFWSLALVRRKDYARAGIPMLPVVRGEKETRSQIFIYTLELVGLTLLMPLFKITGSLFLVSAITLGGWLIFTAWQVLKNGGNKTAWLMYRFSSMYLAFIFLALVLDVLL